MLGTVKWFDKRKGFGFIIPADGGRDIFVHYQDIEGVGYKNLVEGDRVSFELADDGKGPKAT